MKAVDNFKLIFKIPNYYPRTYKVIKIVYIIAILSLVLPFLMSKFNLLEKSLIWASQIAILLNLFLYGMVYWQEEEKNKEVKEKSQ